MNDFTKKELIAIRYAFDNNYIPGFEGKLRDKIQSKIINYCDHESLEQFNSIEYEIFVDKCIKCNHCIVRETDNE